MSANILDAGEWANVGAYLVYSNWTINRMDPYVSGNAYVAGFVANESYWWLSDATDARIYRYNRTTGSYIGYFSTGTVNAAPIGLDLVGEYLYTTDATDDEVYKFYASNGTNASSFSFDTSATGNNAPQGITHNSSHFFIVDTQDDEVYIYNFSGYSSGNFDTASTGNDGVNGIFYNGSSILTTDTVDLNIYVFSITGTPQGNYSYLTMYAAGINAPYGIWGDGINYYISDYTSSDILNFSSNWIVQPMHPMQWLEGTKNGAANDVVGAYTHYKRPRITTRNSIPDSTMNFSTSAVNGTYLLYCWNTTSGAAYGYANNYKNLTYYLISYWSNANELTDSISLYSKEVAITTSRPFLNVTYSAAAAPFVPAFFLNITSPLNNTIYACGTNILLNVTPYGNATGYDIEYSYDHGVNNISLGSTSNGTWIADFLGTGFATGLHNITVYGYNGSVINSSYVNFSIGACASAISFTVFTLGGGGNSTNSNITGSNYTEGYYFNATGGWSELVPPCADANPIYCQDGANKPIYSVLNTGTSTINFFMKLALGSLPSTIELCANATGEVGVTIDESNCDFSTAYNEGAFLSMGDIPAGKMMNITIYANFTNALSMLEENINELTSS